MVIKNNVLDEVAVNSVLEPQVVDAPDHGQVLFNLQSSGVYYMTYTPNQDYTGPDKIVLEYYVSIYEPYYIHIDLDVKSSIIITEPVYVTTTKNVAINLDPTFNDYASHGPITLQSVTHNENGTITFAGPNQITYTPDTDFVGKSSLTYLVTDTIGASKTGTVLINVQDSLTAIAIDTIRLATTNKNPATVVLPLSGFTEDANNMPQHGTLQFIGSDVVEYTSNFGLSTIDTFKVVRGTSHERTIIIQTIHIPEQNGYVVDDYIITTEETAVTFDVQANDIKKNFPITGFSDDPNLVQDASDPSVFTYTPPAGVTGKITFSYTVYNGMYSETATILIWVNNFTPQNNLTYNLSTPKNTPLVINYDVPISNFTFVESQAPIQGQMDIYPGIDTILVGCDEIVGFNMVIYEPNNGFVGSDAFEIKYCLNDTLCEVVKVFVDVKDIGLDSLCLCVDDCVWVGDTDNDGKVSVSDLLPIAYHIGESGNIREEANGASQWYGQHADNWGNAQMYDPSKDIKHVDANGDGLVKGDDIFEITNFYNKYHTLVGPTNLVVKDFPFTLHTDQDTVYAGEYLEFKVHIGDEFNPVINLCGLAYSVNLPPTLFIDSTLVVDFLNDSWFGANASTIELAVKPTPGKIEAAFSRLAGIATSGSGEVAAFGGIIDEDIEGIKTSDEIIEVEIVLKDAKAVDGFGRTFTLPTFRKTIYIDLRENTTPFDADVDITVYPNPTSDILNIHAAKKANIQEVDIYDINGALVKSFPINYHLARLNIEDLPVNLYIAQVKTDKGIKTKKFLIQK